ncbi:MAG: NAD-dependent epimerase/dehydratase family protein [Polyangiales bacterium]
MTRPNAPVRVLLTGGAGFLGKRIISELADLARSRGQEVYVRSLDLLHCTEADEAIIGDITDAAAVDAAVRDIDVIIHTAAMIDWGNTPRDRLFSVNLDGTRHIIDAARRHGARGLIYTGTMDAVMDGGPLIAIDEAQPYPERFMDAYSESKARAEQAVLAANDNALRTVVLRACGMYGEADPYHMENVLTAAREGKLTFRVGSPDTVFEHVYVGNVAYAHALAALALIDEAPPAIVGSKYFVTDQPADNFFEFMRGFVEHVGYPFPPASRTIPAWAAMLAGRINERFARLVHPVWQLRPVLTRSSVSVLTNSISIRSTRLADDLGYQPRYTVEEAFERVVQYYGPRFKND